MIGSGFASKLSKVGETKIEILLTHEQAPQEAFSFF
jgi:hypothetical protein